MKTQYNDFIVAKTSSRATTGLESTPTLTSALFPFQRACVEWALRRGRAALFEDCGLGKTLQELSWAHALIETKSARRVLILAPLAVAQQTVREGKKFGIEVEYSRDGKLDAPITITNYERIQKFDTTSVDAVVIDECFAAGTPVLVRDSGEVTERPIETVRVGCEIINASGIDTVSDVHRREVEYAIKISIADRQIISSPNHPYFTQRGWVCAQDLTPGDWCMEAPAAVRMVQEQLHPEARPAGERTILRAVLLSEMAYGPAGNNCEGAHPRGRSTARSQEIGLASLGQPEGREGVGTNSDDESDQTGRCAGENLPPIDRDPPRSFRAWGQRSWLDGAAADLAGCTRSDLGSGVCFITGPTDAGISNQLQNRLSQRRVENRHRSGWQLTPQPEGTRPEEGCQAGFARVGGLEVLEPGHPELERLRSTDGKLYFYDIGGTRHPSFSVAGFLVHNSSILKSFMGKTKRDLVERFARTPYRLACTATPAPNDHLELGNHAEFLGVMTSHEMISRWFINDTSTMGTYRLKHFAVGPYWDWVTSWARCVGKPSDLGFDDAGFVLPELVEHRHILGVDIVSDRPDGQLFRIPDLSATTVHAERRRTAVARANLLAEVIAREPQEPWIIWCETDYEADALTAAIPEAVEVRGSHDIDKKEERLAAFASGEIRVLVSKASICGFGLNWQHCARVAFIGPTFSFEQYYQAIRRTLRFGQMRDVHVHMVIAETESGVFDAMRRKREAHERMQSEMFAAARRALEPDQNQDPYEPSRRARLPRWLRAEKDTP